MPPTIALNTTHLLLLSHLLDIALRGRDELELVVQLVCNLLGAEKDDVGEGVALIPSAVVKVEEKADAMEVAEELARLLLWNVVLLAELEVLAHTDLSPPVGRQEPSDFGESCL